LLLGFILHGYYERVDGMLKAIKRGVDHFLHGSPPTYPDGTPMPPEEYNEMMREYQEQKLRLDDELYWMTEWDEDDRRQERDL